MQVFKISGKFEQDGKWSIATADFIGYFVKREDNNDVIEGYIEEQHSTSSNRIRYIQGLFINQCQLAFMAMVNSTRLLPVMYDFPNIHKKGFWCTYSTVGGFFPLGCYNGHATVEIEEVFSEELANKTLAVFNENASNAIQLNQMLMAEVDSLEDFLDENSGYHPNYQITI